VALHGFKDGQDAWDFPDTLGLKHHSQYPEQRYPVTDGSAAAKALIHQHRTSKRMRHAQGLRLAFVQYVDGGEMERITVAWMHPHMGCHKIRNLSGPGPGLIQCDLIQYRLGHVDVPEYCQQQLQTAAPCQCNQRPGITDDRRPVHVGASKAASSCSNSSGA